MGFCDDSRRSAHFGDKELRKNEIVEFVMIVLLVLSHIFPPGLQHFHNINVC